MASPVDDTERGDTSDVCDLIYRRSTDFGQSWLPMQVLTGNNSRTTPSIDWYTTVFDSVAKRLFVFIRTSVASGLGSTQFHSTDLGATFSAGTTLTLTGGTKGFKLVTPSMSHGLQLMQGRLVVPFVCGNPEPPVTSGSHTHSCTVFSDNHGSTWELGGIAQNGSAETAFAQLFMNNSLTLYASMRDRGSSTRQSTRLSARSLDGGESWVDFGRTEELRAPCTPHWCSGVVAGLAALNGSGGDPPLLVYSSPSAPKSRSILRLFTSTDEGVGWHRGPILFDYLAGYSDMVVLPNNAGLGVLFENGEKSFSDRISFANIPRSWIQTGDARSEAVDDIQTRD
jgi:sialidase-1